MSDERRSVLGAADEEFSLFGVGSALLRHRALVIKIMLATLLVAAFKALPTPRRYSATASFLPQSASGGTSQLGGLAGLAGQFGVSLSGPERGGSPEFYVELMRSREILSALASAEFSFTDAKGDTAVALRGTLPDLLALETGDADPTARRAVAVQWLRDQAISVSTGRETGLVSLTVTTPWPELSEALAQRLLDLLNDFNLRTRQSQAAAERTFIEWRLVEAHDSLRGAEDRMATFLASNRQWAGSPELTFERDRLQRQLSTQQQVYTTLTEAYEQARIAEVRNTPVITVVERPARPVGPNPRGRLLKLALGAFLGGVLGIFGAFIAEYGERARRDHDPESAEFFRLWHEARSDLLSVLRVRKR